MPDESHHDVRALLVAEMRQHDLARMVATFYGHGDEGHLEHVEWVPTASNKGAHVPASLEDLSERYVWTLLSDAGLDGFENNEGGEGEITLDLATRTEALRSFYYVEATEDGPTYERSISVRAPGARLNRRRRLGHGRQRR